MKLNHLNQPQLQNNAFRNSFTNRHISPAKKKHQQYGVYNSNKQDYNQNIIHIQNQNPAINLVSNIVTPNSVQTF